MRLWSNQNWRQSFDQFLETQQVRMSSSLDALPILSLLGLLCGLFAGGIIILFRLMFEGISGNLLPNGDAEGFESLSASARLLLCVVGGLSVGLLFQKLKAKSRTVGVTHVLERLEYHQGHLPFKNAVLQFFAAIICLCSGQSLGREGPNIHLGAASGSILGRVLRVPNNSVRILIACGTAAGISAAFNTPLAGVIFAMEVIILEYSVVGFAPVIIAAVSATTLTRMVFGDELGLSLSGLEINVLKELPLVVVLGVIVGMVSAFFIKLTLFVNKHSRSQQIWVRTTLAGLITGLIALVFPQVMGTGYDTIDQLLVVQFGFTITLLLILAKTVATASSVGLDMPAGLIGPTLFIGATTGSLVGIISSAIFTDMDNSNLYVVLGMAAMMAATLEAPLAALIYLTELTANHAIVLPGMAVVIIASLITKVLFKQSSIYRHLMVAKGLDYRNTDLSKSLRKIGVASVMDRNITQHSKLASIAEIEALLEAKPRWILLRDQDQTPIEGLLTTADLALFYNQLQEQAEEQENVSNNNEAVNLVTIPAKREPTAAVSIVSTLQEAYTVMQSRECNVLYVTGAHGEIGRAHV